MLKRIFPERFDNTYRGHWMGIVILALLCAIKALQGLESLLNTRETAIRADGIPLDSFGDLAANEVMLMFSLLGFYLLLVPLQSALVLLRYRSMIPLMFIWLLFTQIGVRMIVFLHASTPKDAVSLVAGHPIGFYVNLTLLTITLIGFALSLMDRTRAKT